MLATIGLRRDDIYLTNILKDRAPSNRDPQTAELDIYEPFLAREIEIVQPLVIATLGRFAMYYILKRYDLPDKRGKISALHGKLLQTTESYGTVYIVPLYHPAVVLYSASKKTDLKDDFEKLIPFV